MAKAPKKEKFHSTAPQEVVEMLQEVIQAHHAGLADTEFLVLFKHGGWKSKGKVVFGKIQVLNDAFRRTMNKDVILYLNQDMWAVLSKPQRKYVLDHQLYTIDVKYDRHDCVVEGFDGRPMLTTVPPDIEAFADVVKRHGIIMEDVKRLARSMTELSQVTLEEVLKFEANDNAAADFRKQVEEAEKQHEGIVYTLDGGDVVVKRDDGEPSDDELEIESMESEVSREEREQEETDPDAPLTFESQEDNW